MYYFSTELHDIAVFAPSEHIGNYFLKQVSNNILYKINKQKLKHTH